MAPTPNPTKAKGYLDQLDNARCEGDWDAVPELIRKVRKHAPNRACLALAAEVEHGIVKATKSHRPPANTDQLNTTESGSGNIATSDIEVAAQLPKLMTLIEQETTYVEDRFQAQVAVGWLHWVVGEYNLAFTHLPPGLQEMQAQSTENISEWTRVSMLKSAYLRANCLARNNMEVEALAIFEAAIPPLSFSWNSHSSKKELRYWSELFLTEFCMLYNGCRDRGQVTLEDPNSLACFRSWARWWNASSGTPLAGGFGFKGSVPRRRIWFEYFESLSAILQHDLSYPAAYMGIPTHNSPRSQLWSELRMAETSFENLLLSETDFPKADEHREEVEIFVEILMQNWAILTGRGWKDQDLGQDGKAVVSAAALELLYRASTKTFHSTAILRSLFKVHLAVAEFDLAFKAFDSYLEIVKKGKARVEKTGHPETSLDDDATALETICLCISALTRFGGREAAEKAIHLAQELEQWLDKFDPPHTNGGMQPVKEEGGRSSSTGGHVPAKVLALAWQSIGLAHARWARMTFDSSTRTEVQKKAIRSLRTSLSSDFGGTADVRGVFALGLLLAEQRELTTAIELVKTALLTKHTGDEILVLRNGPFWRERSLIPLWHLLSLLLSARQEYVLAARTCECAFEQFRDPVVLFGRQQLYKSDHLNDVERDYEATQGLVDEMDDYEKENIVEVKMTQLAMVEIMEGPRIAVNASLELLTLFSRLFGTAEKKQTLEPPKTSAPRTSGTFRSIRSGLFGNRTSRADSNATARPPGEKMENIRDSEHRPQTATTVARAPTIQVTQENGSPRASRPRRKSTPNERRSESAKRHSTRKRDSQPGRPRASSSGPSPHVPSIVDGEPFYTPLGESQGLQASDIFSHAKQTNPLSRPSSAVTGNGVNRTVSQGSGMTTAVKGTDITGLGLETMGPIGAVLPVIQFDTEHEKRHRGAILMKIWLMIAGFYRKAGMFEDSKGAVAEAQKIVQGMEAEMGKDSGGEAEKKTASPTSLRDPGWAGKKSIEELWADVWCEMGYLSLAKKNTDSARLGFEAALTHYPDHPSAVVGLSNILLDLYAEKIMPPKAFPGLDLVGGTEAMPGTNQSTAEIIAPPLKPLSPPKLLPSEPLGLGAFKTPKRDRPSFKAAAPDGPNSPASFSSATASASAHHIDNQLEPPYKAASTPLVDRLASRDRAYGLLSNLTKLGTGWNYSEAWFALGRAHEESGQLDKAKEVLWWCVELEEGMGVREWDCVNTGGYVL